MEGQRSGGRREQKRGDLGRRFRSYFQGENEPADPDEPGSDPVQEAADRARTVQGGDPPGGPGALERESWDFLIEFEKDSAKSEVSMGYPEDEGPPERYDCSFRPNFLPSLLALCVLLALFFIAFKLADDILFYRIFIRVNLPLTGRFIYPVPMVFGIIILKFAYSTIASVNRVSLTRERLVLRKLAVTSRVELGDLREFRPGLTGLAEGLLYGTSTSISLADNHRKHWKIPISEGDVYPLYRAYLTHVNRTRRREVANLRAHHRRFSSRVKNAMALRDAFVAMALAGTLTLITAAYIMRSSVPTMAVTSALYLTSGGLAVATTYLLGTRRIKRILERELEGTAFWRTMIIRNLKDLELDGDVPPLELFQQQDYIGNTVGARGAVIAVFAAFFLIRLFLEGSTNWEDVSVYMIILVIMIFSGVTILVKEGSSFKKVAHFHKNILIRDRRFKKVKYLETIDRFDAVFTDTCASCSARVKRRVIIYLGKRSYNIPCPKCRSPFNVVLGVDGDPGVGDEGDRGSAESGLDGVEGTGGISRGAKGPLDT